MKLRVPSSTWPHTHHDLISHYHQQYERDIQAGKFQPAIYPWGGLGAFVVIAYLLIPHRNRPWLKKARYLVFAWYLLFTIYTIMYVRGKDVAVTLGVGLISSWGVIWIGAILVCNDAQTDFQRIERTEGFFGKSRLKQQNEQNRTAHADRKSEKISSDHFQNRTLVSKMEPREDLGPSQRHGEFAWQPYPLKPFVERLDWVLDVFGNFRGAGWNWRTVSTPPPPKWVQEQLYRNSTDPPQHSFRIHSIQTKTFSTRREVLTSHAKLLLFNYCLLDVLKLVTVHDPYFWGLIDSKPPTYFPAFVRDNHTLVHIYRLIVSQFAIKCAIESIFCLAPLFFSGILGPSILGARAEPWMYPATWGSYILVLDKGLVGWWSAWWHQTFRFAFEQPSRKIIKVTGLDPKGPIAKILQLVIAFGLSGVLHASGSFTCHGETRPLLGPIRFFLLQAFAVFSEALLRQSLRYTCINRSVPRWLRRSFTFSYVHFWFYHTAGLLCDDFAKGGVWLFEPIPISLLRPLFGVEGDSWWLWGDGGMRFYRRERWWESGIAF